MIEIAGGAISIDGERLADNAALPAALERHIHGAPTLVVKARSRDDEASVARLLSAANTVRHSGIDLHVADLDMQLQGNEMRPSLPPPVVIVAQFSPGAGKLWSISTTDGSFSDLESVKVGDNVSEAAAASRLRRACPAQICKADLSIVPDTPLIETLLAWKRVAGDIPARVNIAVRAVDDASAPVQGATAVSGRVPPEAIQLIIRGNFDRLRTCYQQGLARDSSLSGTVAVRFVIGFDGKVIQAEDHRSTIPDPRVRDCVIRSFRTFNFPKPEGGIVTVIYPIMLSPH